MISRLCLGRSFVTKQICEEHLTFCWWHNTEASASAIHNCAVYDLFHFMMSWESLLFCFGRTDIHYGNYRSVVLICGSLRTLDVEMVDSLMKTRRFDSFIILEGNRTFTEILLRHNLA